MLSFAQDSNTSGEIANVMCTLMVLCRGIQPTGVPFWAYMCIKPSHAKAFRDARKRGMMNLEEYGTILEWGEGPAPSQEVMDRMERDFGMNHRLEEEMLKKAASS